MAAWRCMHGCLAGWLAGSLPNLVHCPLPLAALGTPAQVPFSSSVIHLFHLAFFFSCSTLFFVVFLVACPRRRSRSFRLFSVSTLVCRFSPNTPFNQPSSASSRPFRSSLSLCLRRPRDPEQLYFDSFCALIPFSCDATIVSYSVSGTHQIPVTATAISTPLALEPHPCGPRSLSS
ncbi:hypothetical protein IF2G_00158 [Cordyceps javanica]|nr:hypothetical protein IF2G_00158 [Cordyceps javanica]